MMPETPTKLRPNISVDHATRLTNADLDALVKATSQTIEDGEQSSWRGNPSAQRLRAFWDGVALSPSRHLIIARLDGLPVGALQIIQPGPLSEVGPELATLDNVFVAPSARGIGLARRMTRYAEDVAKALGIVSLDVVIREDRHDAARLLDDLGYKMWARKKAFRYVDGRAQAGLFFTKQIAQASDVTADQANVA